MDPNNQADYTLPPVSDGAEEPVSLGSQPVEPSSPTVQPVANSAPAQVPAFDEEPSELSAEDVDLIEKAWVEKAKSIVRSTQGDPYTQNKELSKVKAEYIKKRYNRDIKVKP